ncbi:hypothetical protein DFO70_109254 [Cytobacillus firmus]|uniref:Uncharacterized protein n=2 Tax=Cytobacillus TaxID=2675230 RepID=A0A366JR37_CYTFI|nr:hypothetical protein DFO70_109254 [Cytobacillus firmus]TDX46329.1 hypothetical protein DFO72_102811 [Cytobacillus oceanisediminis]
MYAPTHKIVKIFTETKGYLYSRSAAELDTFFLFNKRDRIPVMQENEISTKKYPPDRMRSWSRAAERTKLIYQETLK